MGRGAERPPRAQYSHTTLSNLKLSPLVESCPRSIYSTGTAGRGLGSRRSGHGAPAVRQAPAGPCRFLTTPLPYTDKHLRGLGQSYRRCGARGARALPHAAVGAACTPAGCTAGPRSLLGTCCSVGLQPLRESILASSGKPTISSTQRGAAALGAAFTTAVSSYGPTSRIAPRLTDTRLDLQRISRSTIVDQQQTFIALYMWCCSRHCGTG